MPTIVEALTAVMGDVQAVGKDGRNTQQNYSFRGIDAVVNAVGPALREHGVVVLPRVLSRHLDTYETSKKTVMQHAVIEVEFTFVGPDGDQLQCSTLGESSDAGDKAVPKAHSVAFRTALLQALCIPTDEPDPDESSHERAPARDIDAEAREAGFASESDRLAQHKAAEEQAKAVPAEAREPLRAFRKDNGWPMTAENLERFLILVGEA